MKEDEIKFGENLIIDNKKLTEKKKNNFLLTQKGHFVREVNLNKKCHCSSGKKYKNCCSGLDISGYYDSQIHSFYCDINEFLNKFKSHFEEKKEEKTKIDFKNGNGNIVNSLTNQFEKIYI